MVETQQGVNKGISTFLSFGAKTVQPEILERMLVGRKQTVGLLEQYVREISNNGVNHQVFVVGPRGSGKTHLLRVLYHRVNDLVQQRAIVTAYFAEEEYGISGYLDFLIRIINAFMRWYDADRSILESQLDILRETPEKRQEYVAETIINDYVDGKPLLILSENFDAILEALDKKGQDKLRAWLYQNNRISIIATAQATSPDMGREDRPFYGFFSLIKLPKLTYEESLTLLQMLAQIEQREDMIVHLNGSGKAQVRAINELVKGNHRLLVTFYEFLKADSVADLSVLFIKTMNDLKPYYETFVRYLPPQQQKIIHYLALAKIPQKGTDIAKSCFIATTSLTKQLSELQRQHLIDILPDTQDKRNKLYDIAEPLLRIAIEIGEQREGITALFVDFLALYYSQAELEKQKSHFKERYISEIEPSKKLKYYWEVEAREKAIEAKDRLLHNLKITTVTAYQRKIEGDALYNQGEYIAALKLYKEAVAIDANYKWAWHDLGTTYRKLLNYDESFESFKKAIKIDPKFEWAYDGIGENYLRTDNLTRAIKAFRKSVEINPNFEWGWYDLGEAFREQGKYKDAIDSLKTSIKISNNFRMAWYVIGDIYSIQNSYVLAIQAIQKSIELGLSNFAVTRLSNVIIKFLQSGIAKETELNSLHVWLTERADFAIIANYVSVYLLIQFNQQERALYELPKEQREFFEREILKRTVQ